MPLFTRYTPRRITTTISNSVSSSEPVIEALQAALGREAAPMPPGATEQREVTVMAEKSLPYAVLRKIVASCSAADYTKVSLAVVEREQALTSRTGA